MEIKKLNNNDCWCDVCDNNTAEFDLTLWEGHNVTLCQSCMRKLKSAIDLEMEEDNVY